MHPSIVTALWILTLCLADIEVKYQNGVELKLEGWPGMLKKRWARYKTDRRISKLLRDIRKNNQ